MVCSCIAKGWLRSWCHSRTVVFAKGSSQYQLLWQGLCKPVGNHADKGSIQEQFPKCHSSRGNHACTAHLSCPMRVCSFRTNRIKSSLRVGLDSSTLQDLIRITAEGPPVLNFHATSAVDKWLARDQDARERQRRPHFHFQQSAFSYSLVCLAEQKIYCVFSLNKDADAHTFLGSVWLIFLFASVMSFQNRVFPLMLQHSIEHVLRALYCCYSYKFIK